MLEKVKKLQQKTEKELKELVTAHMTKRDLLIKLNDGSDRLPTEARTYRKDGQIENQTEVYRDVETNKITGTKTITWSYYKTGEVNEIIVTETGHQTKVIKHYLDGKQPTVSYRTSTREVL